MRRRLRPGPEVAAWRYACRMAGRVDRHTPGQIDLMDYRLRYSDLLTLCPQWHDLFVKQTLGFRTTRPDPRILDCGANVGLASLYFKRLYPSARITAYEADPAICTILGENLRANGATDVEVVNAAVWTAAGSVAFRCEGADSGAIDALAGTTTGTRREVPAVRLRSLLGEPIDVLKLDIEGAERVVLEDCADLIGRVPVLLLDLHEFDPEQRSTPAVLDLLGRAGLRFTVGELNPLPWRPPAAPADSPFPGAALAWTCLVRAWPA
ncbi:MAG TPA: FkbM family methyltransferase [Vicinamibacterales bacterium]|nr:FkbM family methyltransferase [Vicinamibacterales bacterium]